MGGTSLDKFKYFQSQMDNLLATQQELDAQRDYINSISGLENLINGNNNQILTFNGSSSITSYNGFYFGITGSTTDFRMGNVYYSATSTDHGFGILGESSYMTIGSGHSRPETFYWKNSIIGGRNNSVTSSYYSIVYGEDNIVENVDYCLVAGSMQGDWGYGPIDGLDFSVIFGRGGATYSSSYVLMGGEGCQSRSLWCAAMVGNELGATGSYGIAVFGQYNKNISSHNTIITGTNNTITANAHRSAIIGGQNITATASDTVYVPKLWVVTNGEGVILQSPNGTKYKLTVDDAGTITSTPV